MYSKYAKAIDRIATQVEGLGNLELAYRLDKVSDYLEGLDAEAGKTAGSHKTISCDPDEPYMKEDFGYDKTLLKGDPAESYMNDFGDKENVLDVAYKPIRTSSELRRKVAKELLKLAAEVEASELE